MCVLLLFCDYCLVLRREKEETFNETLSIRLKPRGGQNCCWIRLEIDFLYFSTRLEKRYREKGEENMKTLSSFLTGFIWCSSDSFLSFVLLVFVDSSTFCSSTHSKMFSWLSTCTGWRNESKNSRVESDGGKACGSRSIESETKEEREEKVSRIPNSEVYVSPCTVNAGCSCHCTAVIFSSHR